MRILNSDTQPKYLESIDLYLDKVGYGRYQILTLSCLFFEYIADGAELTLLALILPCISIEWEMTYLDKCILGAVIFLGMLIGAMSSSKLCDQYGRKIILIIGAILVAFFGLIASLADSHLSFSICRLMVGIGIGLVFPASTTLASEITPVYGRSHYLNSILIAFPIGEIIVCVSSYFYINECIGWRSVVVISSLPGIVALVLAYFIKESPRFLLHRGKYIDAFQVLESYGDAKGLTIKEIYKSDMIKEVNKSFQNKVKVEFSTLLNKKYRGLTIKLWLSWIFVSFMFYGYIFIYPQILENIEHEDSLIYSSKDLHYKMIISSLMNIPSTPIAGFLSEHPKLGRRYSLVLTFAMAAILSLMCLLYQGFIFYFGICVKFLLYIAFGIITIYTTEIYPTKIRNLGNACANSITRIGGIISPFLLEYLFDLTGVKGPYILILLINIFMVFITKSFKNETYKVGIDSDFFISEETD